MEKEYNNWKVLKKNNLFFSRNEWSEMTGRQICHRWNFGLTAFILPIWQVACVFSLHRCAALACLGNHHWRTRLVCWWTQAIFNSHDLFCPPLLISFRLESLCLDFYHQTRVRSTLTIGFAVSPPLAIRASYAWLSPSGVPLRLCR